MTKHQKSNSEKKQGGGAKKLTIEQRAENFKKSIWEEVKGTERESQTDELRKFWEYWSEHGENDRKMRYEKQQSFSIKRRLSTWFSNKDQWEKTSKGTTYQHPFTQELPKHYERF